VKLRINIYEKQYMSAKSNLHLIMGDVHANIFALHKVVEYGKAAGVQHWWSTGDLVGYGCFPRECIRTFQELQVRGVRGNHDDELVGDSYMEYPPAVWVIDCTKRTLADAEIDYIRRIPYSFVEGDCHVGHSLFCSISHQSSRIVFAGHTHIPSFVRLADGNRAERVEIVVGVEYSLDPHRKYSFNPGAVGYPRDGDPRASFMLYDPDANFVKWVRLEYLHQQFLAAMKAQGYPQEIINSIERSF